jgi:hypothetical protein
MAKPRMGGTVKITNPKYAITKQFKNQYGIIVNIVPECSKTYYSVQFNNGARVMFEESEIKST